MVPKWKKGVPVSGDENIPAKYIDDDGFVLSPTNLRHHRIITVDLA